ncbi:hypothetical protein [Bifidobacterium tissieri]|uniref:Uncharacterized protein n=1 Tax=Bifidobacterium tissieri TaxID=1630162 RepID=A0A5M9ZMI5_9BIFI|nr:hypothetical protein [Bifidobacterium tissieri]KAA8828649.1 hypothetical protein EM849_11470 [Bifidobacterium tissieri]KAA8831592.1 hypothetical protein EMO89_02385 [Bifidobacterium tissieri]
MSEIDKHCLTANEHYIDAMDEVFYETVDLLKEAWSSREWELVDMIPRRIALLSQAVNSSGDAGEATSVNNPFFTPVSNTKGQR